MEEIAQNVYLETSYPGVVLGAMALKRGLMMIDAPFRMEDQRSWLSSLTRLNCGSDKLLVTLDSHIDRTLGVRAMEVDVIAQEKIVEILRDQPTSVRGQDIDAGADWEPFDLPATIRWVLPQMTYTDALSIYWDDEPVKLIHRAGAHVAGTWLQYDPEKVLFVGDSVVLNQPPFLDWSDINSWIEELEELESEKYNGYKIISGRNGLVRPKSIEKFREFLMQIQEVIEQAASEKSDVDVLLDEVPELLKKLKYTKTLTQRYHNRLAWGLTQYYRYHYLKSEEDQKGEN